MLQLDSVMYGNSTQSMNNVQVTLHNVHYQLINYHCPYHLTI